MDVKKYFLYGALFFIIFMLWTNWQQQFAAPTQEAVTATETTRPASNSFIPEIKSDNAQAKEQTQASARSQTEQLVPAARIVHIKTDVLDLVVDTLGGVVLDAKLLEYFQEVGVEDKPYVLFNDMPRSRYLAQSGFTYPQAQESAPLHYHAEQSEYDLLSGQDKLAISLRWQDDNGLIIDKIFTLQRGSYLIDVEYRIDNQSEQQWQGSIYSQLLRVEPQDKDSGLFVMGAYVGAAISDPANKLYKKVSFKNMQKADLDQAVKGGWVAQQEHYFISAWVPPAQQESRFYSHVSAKDEYIIGMVGPMLSVAPGGQHVSNVDLYVGPQIAENLKQVAPGLDLTIDYGWLWFISALLFQLLKFVESFIGNWGWSIVIVTVLIKLVFYRLSATSYRSMANMRRLQPRLATLKERYADDKAKFSRAMMELYKKEKINPLGGCLPILVQIPVFIALYWVLLESVELRHAPFVLWIHDLSARDPYYILPILMGLTMLAQQKLSPPPPDPTQAKVMMILPVVFTFLFLQFPAGLVLYWTANNALSILQQWYIMRKVEHESVKKRKK